MGDEVRPPWEFHSDAPNSLFWRMGGGEGFLDRWLSMWKAKSASERRDYFRRHEVPTQWREWIDVVTDWKGP